MVEGIDFEPTIDFAEDEYKEYGDSILDGRKFTAQEIDEYAKRLKDLIKGTDGVSRSENEKYLNDLMGNKGALKKDITCCIIWYTATVYQLVSAVRVESR